MDTDKLIKKGQQIVDIHKKYVIDDEITFNYLDTTLDTNFCTVHRHDDGEWSINISPKGYFSEGKISIRKRSGKEVSDFTLSVGKDFNIAVKKAYKNIDFVLKVLKKVIVDKEPIDKESIKLRKIALLEEELKALKG